MGNPAQFFSILSFAQPVFWTCWTLRTKGKHRNDMFTYLCIYHTEMRENQNHPARLS
uniref:Uncharacterized protein n=1 Tax=Arundo donax TaxID=35708 RepID=A0A0A9H595_ARUDO